MFKGSPQQLSEGPFRIDTKRPFLPTPLSTNWLETLTIQEMLKTEVAEGGSKF